MFPFMMNGFLVIQTRVFASVVLVPLQRAKLLQSCPVLCDPVNHSLPGSSIHGILQARKLEWVAMPSSGDLPDPGIEPVSVSLMSPALSGGFFTTSGLRSPPLQYSTTVLSILSPPQIIHKGLLQLLC